MGPDTCTSLPALPFSARIVSCLEDAREGLRPISEISPASAPTQPRPLFFSQMFHRKNDLFKVTDLKGHSGSII